MLFSPQTNTDLFRVEKINMTMSYPVHLQTKCKHVTVAKNSWDQCRQSGEMSAGLVVLQLPHRTLSFKALLHDFHSFSRHAVTHTWMVARKS